MNKKFITNILKKYLYFSPLILLIVIINVVTGSDSCYMIPAYIAFDAFHFAKKTGTQLFIEHLIRFLTFFIIYEVVILIIG